jgi:hypothetical protein
MSEAKKGYFIHSYSADVTDQGEFEHVEPTSVLLQYGEPVTDGRALGRTVQSVEKELTIFRRTEEDGVTRFYLDRQGESSIPTSPALERLFNVTVFEWEERSRFDCERFNEEFLNTRDRLGIDAPDFDVDPQGYNAFAQMVLSNMEPVNIDQLRIEGLDPLFEGIEIALSSPQS